MNTTQIFAVSVVVSIISFNLIDNIVHFVSNLFIMLLFYTIGY